MYEKVGENQKMEKYTFASTIGTITVFYNCNFIESVLFSFEQLSKDKRKDRKSVV